MTDKLLEKSHCGKENKIDTYSLESLVSDLGISHSQLAKTDLFLVLPHESLIQMSFSDLKKAKSSKKSGPYY